MKDQIISPQTAKLAKQKGFDILTSEVYGAQAKPQLEPYNELRYSTYDDYLLAPTQSLLQKWLREKHNLHLTIAPTLDMKVNVGKVPTNFYSIVNNGQFDSYGTQNSYEEALEVGLVEALNLIPK